MISLCITSYNRLEMLLESFKQVINDYRISEIVISDDCSDIEIYNKIKYATDEVPKIKLFRNERNVGVYHNKKKSVELATNKWVIIGDSDNVYGVDYIDKLFDYYWDEKVILAPDFASPVFSYQKFSGLEITKENVAQHIDDGVFQTMLNTFNFFINKETYLKVYNGGVEPINFDSIYFNYCWLKGGNIFKVVDGLTYYHRVHSGSHFQANMFRGNSFLIELIKKYKELK